MSDKYDDIIHLPHHVSKTRPQMPALDRAAQFAPFAALTGHGAAIAEAGRLTEQKRELAEHEQAALNGSQAHRELRFFVCFLYRSELCGSPNLCSGEPSGIPVHI